MPCGAAKKIKSIMLKKKEKEKKNPCQVEDDRTGFGKPQTPAPADREQHKLCSKLDCYLELVTGQEHSVNR